VELVFNLDELGISDWDDRKTKAVIARAAMLDQTIHHGVSRNVKHISAIACVPAAEESHLPCIVTSQNSSTVQEHLNKQRVRLGSDFALKFNQKAYINAGIFLDYIRTIFLPYIDGFRGLAVLAEEASVLLMDHCSADVSDTVIRILTEARAHHSFCTTYNSGLQVLDLTLFGVLKRCPRNEFPFDENNATVKVMTKVYNDFTQTMPRPNVWETFRVLEFEFDTKRWPYEFLLDEVKLMESAGCDELCPVTFPWTSYRADDVLLTSVGSTRLRKSI
jgi:hypothetical protein